MKNLLLLLPLSIALSAHASQVLEFDDVTLFGGSLSYGGAGGVDPLVGTDILFDLVTGVGTTPSGPLAILGGKLNFVTGPNVSETATLDTFSGGGSFVLTGTVIKPDLTVVATGTLLTGHFVGDSVVLGLGGGNGLFSGVGIDTKNPDLLAYYGIDAGTGFDFAHTDIGFAPAGVGANGSFLANVIDADLANTAQPIPEGGSTLAMCGLGLACTVIVTRRFKRA